MSSKSFDAYAPAGPSLVPFAALVGLALACVVAAIIAAAGLAPPWTMLPWVAAFALSWLWAWRTRVGWERLHPPGVELVPLTDAPEDGMVEERGWVPVGLAPGEKEAIWVLRDAYPELEPTMRFAVTGKSFHRPDEHIAVDGGRGGYFILDPEATDEYEGRKGHWCEWITWRECERGDDRAVECWDLEVVEDEPEEEL